MQELLKSGAVCTLSIPLWSYFNENELRLMGYTQQLSIPLWSYFNNAEATACGKAAALSIPLWSYFNALCYLLFRRFIIFQSHFGLISTRCFFSHAIKRLTFNPTLVLFQHHQLRLGLNEHSAFNPTLVLFQRNPQHHHDVQIPPFNPTLVLFQLATAGTASTYTFAFNPTLVLFQHDCTTPEKSKRKCLSIPLWSYFNLS